MRALADAARIEHVLDAFGRAAERAVRVFLVGGSTAVLMGWRASTVDVDFVMSPEDDAILRRIPELKETLQVNLETASPLDFIPVPVGWEDRGVFIRRVGLADFYHFDLYAQALSKVERGHAQDVADVREMMRRELVKPKEAVALFERIVPELYRFPAVDPTAFGRAVDDIFGDPSV